MPSSCLQSRAYLTTSLASVLLSTLVAGGPLLGDGPAIGDGFDAVPPVTGAGAGLAGVGLELGDASGLGDCSCRIVWADLNMQDVLEPHTSSAHQK